MASTATREGQVTWRRVWDIRWRLWWRNMVEFWCELRKHPVAVLALLVIAIYILAAVFAPRITWHNPERGSLRERLRPPAWQEGGSWDYPLGTDAQGRDIYTRIVYGARVSLLVGFLCVAVSVAVGLALGATSGYYRGKLDAGLARRARL